MRRRTKRRLIDTNALVMGSGVGLATLEAMFNMVNTQSLLSASMIRDHEMAHPIHMQTLAGALSKILAAGQIGEGGSDGKVGGLDDGTDANDAGEGGGGDTNRLLAELLALLKNNQPNNGDTSNYNVDSTTTHCGLDGASTDKLLSELIDLLQEQSHEIAKMSQQHLAVT